MIDIPEEIEDQPCWLDGRNDDGGPYVACANGLLDVSTQDLLPHTPLYFNQTSVPFDYDPSAPPPRKWLEFLNQLWSPIDAHGAEAPKDNPAIAALGEWFGYVVSGRTDVRLAVADRPYNVLFLCTGNSARSIMAEAILNKLGAGNFRAYSTGSRPKGRVHPEALQLLQGLGYDTSGFRSKSWDEFALAGGPELDFAFTVCDNAAAETCPVWPGQPMTAHWGVPDPVEAKGSPAEVGLAFKDAYRMLHQRIGIFTSLPLRSLDRLSLQKRVDDIGRTREVPARSGAALATVVGVLVEVPVMLSVVHITLRTKAWYERRGDANVVERRSRAVSEHNHEKVLSSAVRHSRTRASGANHRVL